MCTPYCSNPYQADTAIKQIPRRGPKGVRLIGVWLYIQKPPPDFKTLYCSWQVYSSDKKKEQRTKNKPPEKNKANRLDRVLRFVMGFMTTC